MPWRITRGVRQDDPLSCLLFNLAIEFLAISLRALNLKGFTVPRHKEKLIASLFTNDTITFLSEDNNIRELQTLLDDWCTALSARFNLTKTKIIPIGMKAFCKIVCRTRRVKDNHPQIPDNIYIAKDGEGVCILGAWSCNNMSAEGLMGPSGQEGG